MLASKFAEYSMLDFREYRIRDWDLNLLFEDICFCCCMIVLHFHKMLHFVAIKMVKSDSTVSCD